MATEGSSPQRAWRAACPGCGAPVEFRSAASASAVCSFCRSTLVRDGDALQRIGVSSELLDDHSPLQLGAGGQHQGVSFTLVGRLQYSYRSSPQTAVWPAPPPKGTASPTGTAGPDIDGTWNEWHALFDNGRSGWLSEDNGAYVFSFDAPLDVAPPKAEELRVGERRIVGSLGWDVASVTTARLIAAQGELPFAPRLQGAFVSADLRNPRGEVGTLDYSVPAQPHWSVGRGVALSELALSGLREDVGKTLGARSIECPNCGAALAITLASTQSIACHQCKSVVDVSQKVGDALTHYQQNNAGRDGAEPTLPLGATAVLSLGNDGPLPWTVVGLVERCDIPEDSDDETTFWREYLLYNRRAGFVFIVDAEDGWSHVRPLTGAPQVRGSQAMWDGASYTRRYRYTAKVTWVQGEFYWRVRRDERALVADYHGSGSAARKRLSREQTGNEVTWSAGETLDAALLGKAFGVPIATSAAARDGAAPLSDLSHLGGRFTSKVVWIVVALIVLMMILDSCSDDCDDVRGTFGANSAEYQQCKRSGGSGVRGGSSSGGWSSGGGHK